MTIGPEGEELYAIRRHESPDLSRQLLRKAGISKIKGIPGHGSAMFRSADYHRAGGYRPQFYFAQDIDLWLRLTDHGTIGFVPDILYHIRFTPGCLSTRYHAEQVALTRLALASKTSRELGNGDAELLVEAAAIRPAEGRRRSGREAAGGFYFIGRCLLDRGDRRAQAYLRAAVRLWPWDLRSWTMLGLSTLRRS